MTNNNNPEQTKISPQAGPQTTFLSSPADICIFGGSAGSGKTYSLLMEPLRHISNSGFGAVIFRRTSVQVRSEGGLWDTSETLYPHVGGDPKQTVLSWDFPSGASVKFAHLEYDKTVLDWQGSQIALICFDELTHFSQKQFFYMLSRNRSICGVRPYIRATTNPDADSWLAKFISWWIGKDGFPIQERSGMLRWFVRVNDEFMWADNEKELTELYPDTVPKSVTFIPAKLADNKILEEKNPDYRANLLALDHVERDRLLYGNWKVRPSAGMYFQREWFEIVDSLPRGKKRGKQIRHWDLAATEPSVSNPDPDWTSGVRLIESEGEVYVADVRHVQRKPAGVQETILHTASADGVETRITMEQEPGSSGKISIDYYARLLSGYDFHGVAATKAKTLRAGPVSAASENGLIKVLRADWNDAFFNELEGFPDGKHDDIVDGLSGAYNSIVGNSYGDYTGQQAVAQESTIPSFGGNHNIPRM